MRTLIEQILNVGKFTETTPDEPSTITEVEEGLRAYYSRYFGAERVQKHFQIPDDFKAYLMALPHRMITEGWWVNLYGMALVVEATKASMSMWMDEVVERIRDGDTYSTDTFWIAFGGWSDKHEFIICCDTSHPDYGKVYDAYDDHPYLNEDFLDDDIWENMEDFLMQYIRVDEV